MKVISSIVLGLCFFALISSTTAQGSPECLDLVNEKLLECLFPVKNDVNKQMKLDLNNCFKVKLENLFLFSREYYLKEFF